jgi:hypothetical protein
MLDELEGEDEHFGSLLAFQPMNPTWTTLRNLPILTKTSGDPKPLSRKNELSLGQFHSGPTDHPKP